MFLRPVEAGLFIQKCEKLLLGRSGEQQVADPAS